MSSKRSRRIRAGRTKGSPLPAGEAAPATAATQAADVAATAAAFSSDGNAVVTGSVINAAAADGAPVTAFVPDNTVVRRTKDGWRVGSDDLPDLTCAIILADLLAAESGAPILVLTSAGVTIQSNTFYNNGGKNIAQAEIFVAGQAGGKIITDWITGQTYDLFTTGMVLSGNTFQNATPGQLVFGTYLGGNDWTMFASTLNSNNNTWYDPNTASSFKIVNGRVVGMAAWQSAVQTDYSSVWQPPTTSALNACAAPAPAYADFNISLDNNNYTMASGKAVATVQVNSFGYGPVTLTAEGMPAGVSASFSQASLTSGVVTLTFNSSQTAVAQTVPITLIGVSGSRVHSATFYLHVNPM